MQSSIHHFRPLILKSIIDDSLQIFNLAINDIIELNKVMEQQLLQVFLRPISVKHQTFQLLFIPWSDKIDDIRRLFAALFVFKLDPYLEQEVETCMLGQLNEEIAPSFIVWILLEVRKWETSLFIVVDW